MELLIHFCFSYLSTVTFGILTNIPRHALLACGLTDAIGWMIYWLTKDLSSGATFANFLGAVGIGLASIYFSRKLKMPMIIFNIPSLVPLVPGFPAYQAVRSIVLGDYLGGVHFILKVIFTAGAIVAGFVVTGIFEQVIKKFGAAIRLRFLNNAEFVQKLFDKNQLFLIVWAVTENFPCMFKGAWDKSKK